MIFFFLNYHEIYLSVKVLKIIFLGSFNCEIMVKASIFESDHNLKIKFHKIVKIFNFREYRDSKDERDRLLL